MPTDDFWADLPENRRRQMKSFRSSTPVSPPSSKRRSTPGVGSGAVWIATVVMLMLLGAASGWTLWLVQTLGQAAHPNRTTPVVVTIEPGRSARTIAANLEDQGLILSRWPLLAYLVVGRLELRAGTYALTPALSTREIAERIANGDVTEHRVTIPEGWRIEQIADLLDQTQIAPRGEFLSAARYDPVRYDLPPGFEREPGDSLEGLLFPDTYQFRYGVTSREIVQSMLENFVARTAELAPTNDQIILASIIEREAKFDDDRAKIAGVYHNRLEGNMRLQADPTVQYARDSFEADLADDPAQYGWWGPITAADYQRIKSPWNTYLNDGLPPTPIAGPGLKSIEAATHPAEHDFFYFFNLPDGTTIYSASQADHDRQKRELLQ